MKTTSRIKTSPKLKTTPRMKMIPKNEDGTRISVPIFYFRGNKMLAVKIKT